MSSQLDKVHATIDELIRVTDGLIASHVSFDTTVEYLQERTAELDRETARLVVIFLVLEVLKERAVDNE